MLEYLKKKKDMQQPVGSTDPVCSTRLGMRSTQYASSQCPLRIPLVNSCWSQEDKKFALIILSGP